MRTCDICGKMLTKGPNDHYHVPKITEKGVTYPGICADCYNVARDLRKACHLTLVKIEGLADGYAD